MTEHLDLGTLYREERARWMREDAPRKTFRDVVAASVPYWIVIVALVLFGLSAPHTAKIFTMITPGWGVIAPIGVEFGLLYAAFRRRLAHSVGESIPWTLWALEILLFVTAILVNGAGAFVSVVEVTNMETLSFTAITDTFATLPATNQAALVMAALSALIIPIGTLVAGEGMATLTLEHRETRDFRDQLWQEVEWEVIYRAVYVWYMQQGYTERQSAKRTHASVRGYLADTRPSAVRQLSAPSEQSEHPEQQPHSSADSVKDSIRLYLTERPSLAEASINTVLAALQDDGVKAGRTSVSEVLREFRTETS